MTTPAPIQLGSPGEDISKKDLHKVMQRFINLSQVRLQRIQEFLLPRQRIFLNLLPLLFHQNHPLLPGFISSNTIAGIPNYTPSTNSILLAKSFSKHFTYIGAPSYLMKYLGLLSPNIHSHTERIG